MVLRVWGLGARRDSSGRAIPPSDVDDALRSLLILTFLAPSSFIPADDESTIVQHCTVQPFDGDLGALGVHKRHHAPTSGSSVKAHRHVSVRDIADFAENIFQLLPSSAPRKVPDVD
jgi:hypothetical protein